jgi:hypothetical protein
MVGGFHLEEPEFEPGDKIKVTVNDTRCATLTFWHRNLAFKF